MSDEDVTGFVEGWLPEASRQRANDHIDRCERCRILVATVAARAPDDERAQEPSRSEPGSEAHYILQEEHARGGLGRLMRARDSRLERPVAIKELLHTSVERELRFVREAKITARLQHPGIVPVYEAGLWPNGTPYYVMKFVSGRTLREVVCEASTLDQRLALVPLVIAVVETIAYAHSQRVIHRDLKPGNLIVGEFGEMVVIDWGLAKDLAVPANADDPSTAGPYRQAAPDGTIEGTVMGTPSYMPPEQARGDTVDERADVYALGAILYHALAGETPYQGTNSAEVLKRVLRGAPQPLKDVQPGVPRDLDAIVAKAMAREARDRYRNAGELAADLRRFQAGQLVGAHDYSNVQLFKRWLGRYRTPVAISTLFTLALSIFGIVGVRQIVRERDLARARSNEMILMQARAVLDKDPTASLAWLKTYPSSAPDWAAAREIAMDALNRGVARYVWRRDDKDIPLSEFSHDSSRFVSLATNHRIQLWSVRTGDVVAQVSYDGRPDMLVFDSDDRGVIFCDKADLKRWDLSTNAISTIYSRRSQLKAVELSSNGGFIALRTEEGVVELFARDGGPLRSIDREEHWPAFDFSRDGTKALMSHANGIRIWDLGPKRIARVLQYPVEVTAAVRFSPDASSIAVLSGKGTLALCNLTAAPCRPLLGHVGPVLGFEFSPDGDRLVSHGSDRTIRLWDSFTATELRSWKVEREMYTVVFSRDARRLFATGQDPKHSWVHVLDIDGGEIAALPGDTDFVYFTQSPDGHFLATSSLDRKTRLWEFGASPLQSLGEHHDQVQHVVFSRDGNRVATASRDHTVRVWDLVSGKPRFFREPSDLVFRVAISPNSKQLAAGGFDKVVHTWTLQTGEYRPLVGHTGPIWDVAYSPDGTLLASASGDGTIRLSDSNARLVRVLTGHRKDVRKLAFSPDGRMLASGGDDHTIRLWDLRTGTDKIFSGHTDTVYRIAFASDGSKLVSSGWDGAVLLWDLPGGAHRVLGRLDGQALALAVSADGHRVAAGGIDHTIHLWNITSGEERILIGHQDLVRDLAFSPDGRLIASASADRSARLWSVSDGRLQAILPNTGVVTSLTFSPDGRRVASVDTVGNVRLWRVDELPQVPISASEIIGWLRQRTSVVVDDLRP